MGAYVLEEHEQVLVHPDLLPPVRNVVNDALHCLGVATRVDGCVQTRRWLVRVGFERHSAVGVVLHHILEHLVAGQRRVVLPVTTQHA